MPTATSWQGRRAGRCAAWACALATILVVAACSGPVQATPPSDSTAGSEYHLTNGVCAGGSTTVGSIHGSLVTVDVDPVGATIIWRPGLSTRPCGTRTTHLDQRSASRLATAIRRAPGWPYGGGSVDCPADDNSAATIYFSYTKPTRDEVVTIALTGCATVGAPHRKRRLLTARIIADLRAAAPLAWRPDLQD